MPMPSAANVYRPWAAALVLLTCLVAGGVVPGSKLDRWVFARVAGMFHPQPVLVGGFGTRTTPWNFRAFNSESDDRRAAALGVVWVGDDPEGIFQSSPPSPVDYAVMFANFHRTGVEQVSCGVVLAWDEPDMIGVMALEKSIAQFASFTAGVPLARGASAEPLPPAFRRSSLPLAGVRGKGDRLPLVNRVAVPDALMGGKQSWAGFTGIESEPDGGYPFLCARWDDRVIFSFTLCHVLRQLDLPIESVVVWPGKWIRLGKKGPVIPIDETGRMLVKPATLVPAVELVAEDLIDASGGWLPSHVPEPVLLADRRGMADESVRAFSDRVCDEVALMVSDGGFGPVVEVARIASFWEWLGIEWVAFTLVGLLWVRPIWAMVGLVMFSLLLVAVHLLAFQSAQFWLPGAMLVVAVPLTLLALGVRGVLLRREAAAAAALEAC